MSHITLPSSPKAPSINPWKHLIEKQNQQEYLENDEIDQTIDEENLSVAMRIAQSLWPEEALYLFNERALADRLKLFQKHFIPEKHEREIAYAVKANPRKRVLKILGTPGGNQEGISHFDCASIGEIERVLETHPNATILYNHPIKRRKDIQNASFYGVNHYTAQTKGEIDKILENTSLLDPRTLEIAIRMKTPNSEAGANLSEKFGADPKLVPDLIKYIREKSEAKVGLSIHTGSQNPDPHSYQRGIQQMLAIAKAHKGVHTINIGGGLPANYLGYPEVEVISLLGSISDTIRDHIDGALSGEKGNKIIIEPGRAMVAETTDLFFPVVATEKDEQRIYTHEGRYMSFLSARMHGYQLHLNALREDPQVDRPFSDEKTEFEVYGMTCDSADSLGKVDLPTDIKEGDLLHSPTAGAYTDASATGFNGFNKPKWMSYNPLSEKREQVVDGYKIRSLTSIEITPEITKKVADFYRYTFNNNGHYGYFPKSQTFVSPQEIFSTDEHGFVSLAQMDSLKGLPSLNGENNEMIIFHDPDTTTSRIEEKLKKNANLTIIEDEQTGEMIGFTFGYGCSLKEGFEKEWKHTDYYCAQQDSSKERDFDKFMKVITPLMEQELEKAGKYPEKITENTQIFISNCVAISPKAQGKKLLPKMMQQYQESIPERMRDRIVIGEAEDGGRFQKILEDAGNVSSERGYLSDHWVFIVGYHETSINGFARNHKKNARKKRPFQRIRNTSIPRDPHTTEAFQMSS